MGDQCWWNDSFMFIWNLVIPINPLGVRHPTKQCGMLTPYFLHIFRCGCYSWGSTGGTSRTSGCPWRFWSGLVECDVFVVLAILELVLINCELCICNETLFWLICNCELLFLDFNDNYYILLLLSSDWYIVSLDC